MNRVPVSAKNTAGCSSHMSSICNWSLFIERRPLPGVAKAAQ